MEEEVAAHFEIEMDVSNKLFGLRERPMLGFLLSKTLEGAERMNI